MREEEEARKHRQEEMKRSLGTKEFPVYARSVAHSGTSIVYGIIHQRRPGERRLNWRVGTLNTRRA